MLYQCYDIVSSDVHRYALKESEKWYRSCNVVHIPRGHCDRLIVGIELSTVKWG